MEVFENKSKSGNEVAIRRGHVVPENGITLAYAKSPGLSPDKNIVIIDTSRIIEENALEQQGRQKLMFANSLGVLEDIHGNQLVQDEYPVVTDTFRVDEDWSTLPGSEYKDEDILPFLHISRHFHVDFAGLTMGSDLFPFTSEFIRVIDSQGRTYVDSKGKPRYKIKITAATRTQSIGDQGAYRVYAFVDNDTNENLYLTYSKIEIGANGFFKNQEVGYRELINPQPYFDYRPEESEVVDPTSRESWWYSTKPLAMKNQILGLPSQDLRGYKVYVPKKAVSDPRLFQLFRWRVSCTFTQNFQIDRSTDANQTIRAGVIVTNSDPIGRAPYTLLNLSRSFYNATQVSFVNPISQFHSESEREKASYWAVNLDTVTDAQLSQFDLLIWAPQKPTFDFAPYISKINTFVTTKGKTLFVDSNDYTVAQNFGLTVSDPVNPVTGAVWTAAGTGFTGAALGSSITHQTSTDELIDASDLGGWDMLATGVANQMKTLTYIQSSAVTNYLQYIGSSADWTTILKATKSGTSTTYPVTVRKDQGKGTIIFSTAAHLQTANALFDFATYKLINDNIGSTLFRTNDYTRYINSSFVEGAYKLLFNVALLAVSKKDLSGDETSYGSSWTFSSNWFSSWVINASDGALADHEKAKYGFAFLPKDVNNPTPVWQRKLSNKTVKQLIDGALTPDMQTRMEGTVRTYVIERTNSSVSVPTTLGPNSYPYAWTEIYTPKFLIPANIGAHIVKEEEVEGHYEAGEYLYRQYPAKPYQSQIRATYHLTSEWGTVQKVNWTMNGTATETTTITKTTPPSSNTNTSEIKLTWASHGQKGSYAQQSFPYFGMPTYWNVMHWQDWNYYTNAWGPGHLNWYYWGHIGRHSENTGSTGAAVSFIQDALNDFHNRGYFGLPSGVYLTVDGSYGPKTSAAIRAFQSTFKARYLDGVVDAETWSLIGAQVIRSGRTDGIYGWPYPRIQKQNMSDGNNASAFTKRSWVTGGPSVIWDLLFVVFNQQYNIHKVSVTPIVEGQTPTMMVRSVDIRTQPLTPLNYDSQTSMLKELPYRPHTDETVVIPFNAVRGDTVIIGMGQDGPAWQESRMFGVREIAAYSEVSSTTTTPGDTTISQQTKTINISVSGSAEVTTGQDVVITPQYKYTGKGQISNIKWNSVSVNNPNVTAVLGADGRIVLSSHLVADYAGSGATFGPTLPSTGTTYYSMDENGRINPIQETGWVSKTDGIKLLCDNSGNPFGFPSMPTGSGPNETQRHFSRLSLVSYGSDNTVQIGFYDRAQQEFIVNASGEPDMSFIEYMDRGAQNVYVGVVTTYEVNKKAPIPVADDAPKLPRRWAMPVYGIYQRAGSRITLEPLPKTLGSKDLWPVAVRTGSFDRQVQVRNYAEGPLTGYLRGYQGTTVTAYYGIPEADMGGWSTIYGAPNADVKQEEPIILDDDVIQVRQAPILMVQEPTIFPSKADPKRPIFTVYKRSSVVAAWQALPWSEIRDFNASTGEIFLETPMQSTDPALWKVDYTTARRHYYFKKQGSTFLNLNPYPGHIRSMLGTAIYIYIVPEYVKDKDQNLISTSVQTRTLRVTTSPEIFDPIRPEYDPLAIQLGVIYVTTSLDINDLVVLDARRRGGGALDSMTSEEVVNVVKEASTYWDIGYGAGMSYQKGGFVIIRLPSAMRNDFTEEEITAAIQRNITAGVGYKLEDLNGNDWV